MTTIYDALNIIRNSATSEKDKGTQYERLARYYLKIDQLWRNRFSDIWMWGDAPTNDGADIGIDLVAKDAADGSLWAIQCKCYDGDSTLHYGDVATFYGKTGNQGTYGHTMIVTSAGRLSGHLDSVADEWGTVRIFSDDMEESEIDFEPFFTGKENAVRIIHEARPHQIQAINDCVKGFKENDRGQLIMACGTGKTLTALRLTEKMLQDEGKQGGRILFLAPSIALVGQTMRAWANQSTLPLICAVVCSDAKASHSEDDIWESALKDIPYPASTDPKALFGQLKDADDQGTLVVIFSTYHSIQVVADAQAMGLPEFDIVFCDEAHRTTGAVGPKEEVTEFVKVHDNNIIKAKKRLYMTATPRIYGDRIKKMAKADSYVVSSMDDIEVYGSEFHHLSFGRAVDEKLLTDYKVIALTMSEDVVSEVYQRAMAEAPEGFDVTESARIIGCWKGLLDQGKENGIKLKNAVAFCSTIEESKRIVSYFQETVDAYIDYEHEHGVDLPNFRCKIHHVDGSMDSKTRTGEIKWLSDTEDGESASCRILSNARCLAEGVDVPNLDAVLFLQPKRSQIDITQAVGRVMRKFEGKEFGYIILPIVIPAGLSAEEALDDNQTYAAVWDILKALRSHDERLDARINAINFDKQTKDSVVSVVDVTAKDEAEKTLGESAEESNDGNYQFDVHDYMDSQAKLQEAVNAMVLKKCGTKIYWDIWAKDIAKIAARHIERITNIVTSDEDAGMEFAKFLKGLQDSLNGSISEEQAVEMLAQHIITLPVFEALFGGAGFAKSNPVSMAMEKMLSVLRKYTLETAEEKRELDELYASVRMRAEGIQTDAGRQAVIKELYESFFKEAFKATSEKMGIVYTPNQVVDYILNAADRLLYNEFGQHLSDRDVHILDAFTGTGTFIVNLINDKDLMPDDKLPYKYMNEIHCNEIMLLAYYIATINIEHAYHARMERSNEYLPFPGAVLTDTFQMYEKGDAVDRDMFVENSERGLKQMELPIHVLIGNPPWSAWQNSENDNNKNEQYPTLDARISETYVAQSTAALKNSLYDSYIRAFRWASDRIGEKGIVAFVTNGGWLRSNSANGFRKCLAEEFNSIYVFDLRGNARTSGEQRRKEKDNVFGQGTRAPVMITLLIKNPSSKEDGVIRYHDIGDYLTTDEKLSQVGSAIKGENFEWTIIHPDRHGDWVDQRDDAWYEFAPLGLEKNKNPKGIFETWSAGIKTNRDVWAYSFSKKKLVENMDRLIGTYSRELERWESIQSNENIDDFVTSDSTKISWSTKLKQSLVRGKRLQLDKSVCRNVIYRPYCKQFLYYDSNFNDRQGQMPVIYPVGKENLVIDICDRGCLILSALPDLEVMHHGQCFPLYYYEKTSTGHYKRYDAITDEALELFQKVYPTVYTNRLIKNGGPAVTKEDIFYYIYGVLHSPEYRSRFESNLKKELPRIPFSENFVSFASQGRALAEIHVGYESADKYPLEIVGDSKNPGSVKKLRWGKKKNKETGKQEDDRTVLVYNENLTFKKIPEKANDYVVNGRSPLEWMIDRYQIKVDKASGITNDPNQYSDNPCYISDLIQRLVTVSVKTADIIDHMLPINEIAQPLEFPDAWKIKMDTEN